MSKRLSRRALFAVTAGVVTATALPLIAAQNPASGPIARYDVKAGTSSGMTAGGGAGAMMSMMMGGRGGANVQHELLLRMGSSQGANPAPAKAEHFMPPGAKLGKSVMLGYRTTETEPDGNPLPQKPKGRLLIFWGCGEHAPKGQPVVVDFAKAAAGQMPAGFPMSAIPRDFGPTPQNSRTYGHWPFDDNKSARGDSSILGAHRIASNYGPEISFTATKDFMQPLRITSSPQAGGAALLNWNGIPDTTGYLAFISGGKMGPNGEMGDMVMWSSSASRQFGGGLSDYLTPAQVAPLVKDGTILPPGATSCIVPAEVRQASPDFMAGTLTAFGPEENFSYPPRPPVETTPWHLQWTARIRHRSTTGWMEAQGMSMGGMGGQAAQSEAGQQDQGQQKRCKPKGGLGGMLGGAVGGVLGGAIGGC
jgi:hypothetical protein